MGVGNISVRPPQTGGKAALSDLDGLELAVEPPVDNLLALDEP
jgi:hypothetical protein